MDITTKIVNNTNNTTAEFKKNHINLKGFFYELISGVLILGTLLSAFLVCLITKTGVRHVDYPFSYVLFPGQFGSYFTYQSNLILGLGFFFKALNYKKNLKFFNSQNVRIAIMSYISVTGVTFITILLPNIFHNNSSPHPGSICQAIILHIFSPIIMIFYTFKNLHYSNQTSKQYFKKTFGYYLIYPGAYTFYLLIRILFFFTDPFSLFEFSLVPAELIFPYVAPYDKNVIFEDIIALYYSAFIVLIVAHILFIFFNILYFFIIKKITKNGIKKTKLKK